jgi:hypothetical protein
MNCLRCDRPIESFSGARVEISVHAAYRGTSIVVEQPTCSICVDELRSFYEKPVIALHSKTLIEIFGLGATIDEKSRAQRRCRSIEYGSADAPRCERVDGHAGSHLGFRPETARALVSW